MDRTDSNYSRFVQILREELVPAMGCTEPIAIAYGAAKARETLGRLPERVTVEASGNIIKNVKSVTVPNTGGLKGIEAAVCAGCAAGRAELELEVLSQVGEQEYRAIRALMARCPVTVLPAEGDAVFDIVLTLSAGEDSVTLRIRDYHTNVVHIERNGEVLLQKDGGAQDGGLTDRSCLSVESIVDFAETADLEDFRELVERQVKYNCAISEEGMSNSWGANVGKVLESRGPGDIETRIRALAAAASDARMGGCAMPVVTVCGSGNQGIAASIPVVAYAGELDVEPDKMLRAVVLSDLLAIHMKEGVGRLSAYCGAVCAGCAAGGAICWLCGGDTAEISATLTNALATLSGMICDGAKPSCAAKIAAAVGMGLLGWRMAREGQSFASGEGIVGSGVEETIRSVGRLSRVGMRETDRTILRIMTGRPDPQ